MKKVVYIVYAFIAIILLVAGRLLLHGDIIPFLQWWVTIVYLGIIFMPLSSLVFQNFHDKGYLFSKTVGIAVTGYIMWLLSSIHLLKFNTISCIISVIIGLGINCLVIWLGNRNKDRQENRIVTTEMSFNRETIHAIITEELAFLAIFLLFSYVRGFKPEAYGTEKFMDYGFMTSMMRSDYMPPQDFWYAGTSLNYYYVGQFMSTFLTRLSFVKVSVGYNLMLMMVGAFAVVLPYSLIYNVALQYLKDRGKRGRLVPAISGIIGGVAVCIAGNMHYPTFQFFEPLVRKFFAIEGKKDRYWFPDATRFIGYDPETHDKTIHEFPAYSFVLGDLHAHVINIMFVLTLLAILFAWMVRRKQRKGEQLSYKEELLNPALILITFLIGLSYTSNFWDFPIYFVVSGAVILFTNLIVYNFKGKAVSVTALQGLLVLAGTFFFALPFIVHFDQISTTPRLAQNHTALNQLIILWGLPVFVVVGFICFMISDFRKDHREHLSKEQRRKRPVLPHLMESLTTSDFYIIILGLCAMGLVLLPELIYIEDIYSGDYKRANTMFKLTYQAFIMFGLCFGYIFLRLIVYRRTRKQLKFAIVGLGFFLLSVTYIQNAVNAWYGNIFKPSRYEGLDATKFMYTEMPEDMEAINWLNENVEGMPVVLEANGNSYTDYERVSVMTGLPTILGWRTHEWLWKSSEEAVKFRESIVKDIYTSQDEAEVRSLLEKYKVAYIYVGGLEHSKFPEINDTFLKSLGEVVYSSLTGSTYIVKISQ